jgi:uncharacterized membrane protein YbhN (UPF0104 family)
MKSSKRSLVLRLGITLGLLALLFGYVVHPAEVLAQLGKALRQPGPLLWAFLLYCVLGSIVRGLRWQALARGLGHEVSVVRTTELFLVGTFFNQFLPTGMGGDLLRALALARDGMGKARAASTVLIDRALGLLPLLALGLAALPAVRDHTSPAVTWTLLVLGLAGTLGLLLLFRVNRWLPWAERLPLLGRLLENGGLRRFLGSFAEYDARSLARSTAWGFAFAILLIGANASLGQAIGIRQMSLYDWAIFVPLVAMSALLPSIGGWGVREVLYAGLLASLPEPVPAADATALSILFGGMNLLLAAVGGVLTGMGSMIGLPDRGQLEAAEEALPD